MRGDWARALTAVPSMMHALFGDFVLLARGLEGLEVWGSVEEAGRVSCGSDFPGG